MTAESFQEQYVSGAKAARKLGCIAKQVPKLAAKGFITVRRVPGCAPRYLLSDVELLVSNSTVPATIKIDDREVAAVSAEIVPGPAETRANDVEGVKS